MNEKQVRAEYLPIEKLHAFENHPFQVRDDDQMEQLVWSILSQGVMTPIIVRPTENGEYEVISGHPDITGPAVQQTAVLIRVADIQQDLAYLQLRYDLFPVVLLGFADDVISAVGIKFVELLLGVTADLLAVQLYLLVVILCRCVMVLQINHLLLW